MRYCDLYKKSLGQISDPDQAFDVQLLMERVFSLSRTDFFIKKEQPIASPARIKSYYRYFRRLRAGEPVAYILKKKEFYSDWFWVNQHVLIPRPETEILVEQILAKVQQPLDILEIGAGSGNISITLAKYSPVQVIATEISQPAIRVLRKNISFHGVQSKVKVCWSDLFPQSSKKFDIIVSNPPYLSESEWEESPLHIKSFEPRGALVGGKTGLEILERIIDKSRSYLNPGGKLFLEIGYLQHPEVLCLMQRYQFQRITFFSDYQGISRVAYGER